MATFTTTTDRFPYNTTVTVYPQSNWPTGALPPSGAPLGSSTTSAVVSSASVLTFTGLADDTAYFMTAEVGGSYRYVGFTTHRPITPVRVTGTPGDEDRLQWDASSEAWVAYDPGTFYSRNGCMAPTSATPYINNVTVTMTAGRTYFTRFVPDYSFTITTIAILVSVAAGANDAIDVGVFNSDLSDRLGSSGSTSGKLNAGTGAKTVTDLSIPVQAGTVYYGYVAMPSSFGGSAPGLACTNSVTSGSGALFGSAVGTIEAVYKDGLTFPVPDAAITSPSATGGVPILGLRES